VAIRVLPVVLALALLAAGFAQRGQGPAFGGEAPLVSSKRSSCGVDAGRPPRELGLERARELTLCLHNQRRTREGLPRLRRNPHLELAAQRYAEQMVAEQFFAHEAPNGSDPQDRILMAGYPSQAASTGENLAWGEGREGTPVEIVDGWMHSPGHRKNVLRPHFAEAGIGIVFDVPRRRPGMTPGATYAVNFGGAPLQVQSPSALP
jgi:Cysteine-rich secretory protein family